MNTIPPRTRPNGGGGKILFAMLGAIVGAFIVVFCQNGFIRLVPQQASYMDLAAVLLTAVSVVVAIFGGVLALAAIWGFKQLKMDAVAAAVEAGSRVLVEQIENGPLKVYIEEQIRIRADEVIKQEIASEKMEERIRARVDQVAFGNKRDRDLDEPESSTGEG